MLLIRLVLAFGLASQLTGCTTSTEEGEVGIGRRQFLLIPNSQIIQASYEGYEQTKREAAAKGLLDRNPDQVQRVQNIMRRIVPQTAVFRRDAANWAWEAHVITSDDVNAYCMPGGKIAFYSSIIDKLQLTDDEIAAIMGHEIAHALREHGREKMSQELVKQLGITVLVASGKLDAKYAQAANMITTLTVTLRHGRQQETEADDIGVELAARSGFDPRAAISLWKKMDKLSGGNKMPEFLSTHPSNKRRIAELGDRMAQVVPLYEKTKVR